MEKFNLQKKESTAKIFYSKLLKSRIFYGFIKNGRNKKYFEIINHNYIEYREISLKRNLLKTLIYSYNRKKMIDEFLFQKSNKIKNKIFTTIKNKLRFRIQNRKLYFTQLSENQFSVDFIYLIINCLRRLKLPIRKNSYFGFNFNVLKIKKENSLKYQIFNFLKKLHLNKVEKEKNLVTLAYNFQNKTQKSFIFHCYSILFSLRILIKRKKAIKNFIRKLFLIRFYFNKYKKEALNSKIISIKNKFSQNMIRNLYRKLYNNAKLNLKKKGISKVFKLKGSKIINNSNNISFYNYNNQQDNKDELSINTTTNKNIKEIINSIQEKNKCNKLNAYLKTQKNKTFKGNENGFDLTYSNNENIFIKNKIDSSSENKNGHSYSQSISITNSLFGNNSENGSNAILSPKNNYKNIPMKESYIDKIYENKLEEINRAENVHNDEFILKDTDILENELKLDIINFNKRKDTNSLRISFIKHNLDFIKKITNIKAKLRFINRHKIKILKKDFLRNLRILCIESLVSQAVIEKYNILKRKIFLKILRKCSINKKRIEQFAKRRLFIKKQMTFQAIKNLKASNAKLVISKVKYCLKLLFLKIRIIKQSKLIEKMFFSQKRIIFIKNVFFVKVKNLIREKNGIYQKYKSLIQYVKTKISIKSFLRKILKSYTLKVKKSFLAKKNSFKQYKNNSKVLIKLRIITLLKKKLIMIKYIKRFLKNTFKLIDINYNRNKLSKIYKKYLINSCFKHIDSSLKNKNLIRQISQFTKLKKLSKTFKGIKCYYMNQLKSKMIKQSYDKYLMINFLKLSINSIINSINKGSQKYSSLEI